jgi:hypothetical protein
LADGTNKTVSAHRLAFALVEGRWPKLVDHINGSGSDNRWSNLREATNSANGLNRLNEPRGVRVERNGRYTARLRGAHLGTFDSEEDARKAYRLALTAAKAEAFG